MLLRNRLGMCPSKVFAALCALSVASLAPASNGAGSDPHADVAPTGTANAARTIAVGSAHLLGTPLPGITVSESGGATVVTEGGAGDSYSVVLNTAPASPVTVSLSFNPAQLVVNGDSDGSLSLVFTPDDWSEPQTVNVAAVDDILVEGPHTSTIVQSASSADPEYASIDPADVVASITDNDTAAVIFASTGFSVVEGATFSPGARLQIIANGTPGGSLSSPIVATLVLSLGTASADDVAVTISDFTFPAGTTHNSVSMQATVAVADDLLVEAIETFALQLQITSGQATTTASNAYQILSDDTAAITFASASSSVGESSGTALVPATVSVSGSGTGAPGLATDISVAIIDVPQSATTPADYQLLTPSLVFPSGTPSGSVRNVEVAIVNDALIEGNHTFQLGFGAITSLATGVSASGSHTVTVLDDDFAGVTITESGGSTVVTEGGATDSFTIALTAQPTSDVTITFDVGSQVSFTPNPLVIAPANWNVPQTVVVAAIDDDVNEGPHSATVGFVFTGDANYAAFPPNAISLTVSIIDNDVPGVLIVESDGNSTATEGGAGDSYTVQLQAAPTQEVSIAVNSDAQLQVSPGLLSFTSANWSTPQTVSISAVDDALIEGPHTGTITHVATSLDADYSGIAVASVTVAVVDNDFAGVTLTASDGDTTVTESSSGDSFTLQLNAQPASDVTISFDVGTQLSFAPNPLVITPAQWNVPQTIAVTAIDDDVAQGARTVSVALAFSGDPDFAAIPTGSVAVAVSIVDNDSAGIVLVQSGGSTQVTEGGAGDDYTLRLSSQPTAEVQIAVDGGDQLVVSPTLLSFTAANWNLPQMVTVNAIDDGIVEGEHSGSVSHALSSADPAYGGLVVPALAVAISDNIALVRPQTIPASREATLALLALLLGLFGAAALGRREG